MRSKILTLLMLLSAWSHTQAQTAADYLDDVITEATTIQNEVQINGDALRSLVIDYFVLMDPAADPAAYAVLAQNSQSMIEGIGDALENAANQAAATDPCVDATNILSLASQIESLSDDINFESGLLRDQLLAGDDASAFSTAQSQREDLRQEFFLARQIIEEAELIKATSLSYNVRIELVDALGNPVTGSTGLMGYFAEDTATGTYFYPDFLFPDEFTGLKSGTYIFGAFDGVFDGASNTTVTLDPSLVGSDGYIVVNLVYWSE